MVKEAFLYDTISTSEIFSILTNRLPNAQIIAKPIDAI